jgi:hypothetical protein
MEYPIMNRQILCGLLTIGSALGLQSTANATFHLMQIEQVIASVNGDNTAQAIQLRMRANVQNFVSSGRLIVVDAAGLNPITLIDLTTNVGSGATGDHVLVASASFPSKTTPVPAVPDFFMTSLIPPSYFAAGSLIWQSDSGIIYWRLSWGGAAYTGPTTGNTANDIDGDFGPPFPTALPSCGVYGVRFTKAANAKSTTNAADYKYDVAQTEQYVNNAGSSYTVSGPLPTVKINVLDANASEVPATDTGKLRVTRATTCTQVALKALYATSGTATNGADYQTLTGTANIPVGATTAMITIRAINDAIPEPNETAILTLSPNSAYTIGAPNSGTVTIHSDE